MKANIPSCGLTTGATTAHTAASSGRFCHSARTPRSMNTTPTESTWPQTTLSNQVIGTNRNSPAPARASRSDPPSSRIIDQMSQPMARSERIAGILTRSSPGTA